VCDLGTFSCTVIISVDSNLTNLMYSVCVISMIQHLNVYNNLNAVCNIGRVIVI
jgi:hypothetical protein